MNTSSAKNSRAFTLVETLVAIAILMISISGPLAIANKALVASLYAKDQSTASFLAQEEMEVIKNIKDNNVAENGGTSPNSNWLNNGLSTSCNKLNPCEFSISSAGLPSNSSLCSSNCLLYADNTSYNNSSSGNPTIFSRFFYLTGSGCVSSSSGSECQATVVVTWYEGTVQNAVTMQSELLNVAP